MKKYIIGIAILLLLTGCTNIYDSSYDQLIDETLKEDNVDKNTYLEGYKLYLPSHITLIRDIDSNNILYSYGDKYYLYVDLISYYNKKQNEYKIDHEKYEYSKDYHVYQVKNFTYRPISEILKDNGIIESSLIYSDNIISLSFLVAFFLFISTLVSCSK